MILQSTDGSFVTLEPVGYQFPDAAPSSGDPTDDANWLLIRVIIARADGRTHEFTEPCLLVVEARRLATWLEAVAAGDEVPSEDWTEESLGGFVEPVLAFSLASWSPLLSTVRLHLSLEGRPPWLPDDGEMFTASEILEIENSALRRAAAEWLSELRPYPER